MMERWHNANETRKLIILGVGTMLVGLMAYQFSMADTLELLSLQNQLEVERESLTQSIAQAQSDLSPSKESIQTETSVTVAQGKLLDELEAKMGAHMSVARMTEPTIHEKDGNKIMSLTTVVEGNFHNQVKLVHQLETELQTLYLQSASLQTHINRKTHQQYLQQELHFKALIL